MNGLFIDEMLKNEWDKAAKPTKETQNPLLERDALVWRVGWWAGRTPTDWLHPQGVREMCCYLATCHRTKPEKAIEYYNSLSSTELDELWHIYNYEVVPRLRAMNAQAKYKIEV